jgi:hypothetical protein
MRVEGGCYTTCAGNYSNHQPRYAAKTNNNAPSGPTPSAPWPNIPLNEGTAPSPHLHREVDATAQVGARHGRKEMVLDLVIQAAEEEVDESAAAHVA